ncbi:uncharacterized protein BP01DRAFT_18024 [Aspergillus saccharolyticus JOP 1030-1]|uniref:Uncharacterized protein n=1 Tax=Aspergillus saccharolyticus JOP 1030-1 TaxID=1450539 RepID=A0A318ZRL9_9EURO|nr:hypothetical protein BP01DRAFT_18024 [Aspergillus saccharolyticus JOP 1030-1]PYH46600.1 hypothetical protein BP01DRAFT_18024 [Aspergillus saccharolyticus JOP 1030-1]
MSLFIGNVFNKALQKAIPVYIAESGEGYKRLTGVIAESVKNAALAKIKAPFEEGRLFKFEDMKEMHQLTITNMCHPSDSDPQDHYSIQGEGTTGEKVKGGHVPDDASKQTQTK